VYWNWGWRPYVSVAERRQQGLREVEKLRKKGVPVSPLIVEGRVIAKTFWGKAWCDNLERYSDYENRLPRGRTYVRNGSVIDLQIAGGEIKALVSGSDIYKVGIKVTPVTKARWRSICEDCAGAIDSLVELLQGRFSKGVMERICQRGAGLFPSPTEIKLSCSCPDWADMCKHVAAVLYGIGARLDHQPELLFRLHGVDEHELIANAGSVLPLTKKGPASAKVLAGEDLSELFGLDIAASTAANAELPGNSAVERRRAKPKGVKTGKKKAKLPRSAVNKGPVRPAGKARISGKQREVVPQQPSKSAERRSTPAGKKRVSKAPSIKRRTKVRNSQPKE
jgi:uncharacterized Zn finger protein